MKEMIRCEQLCKSFVREKAAEEFYAVDHVSLEAHAGEIVGILGPNGAGKTTLLRMLTGMMQPDSGVVEITDREGNILADSNERKRCIGYLSNNTKLYERLTARELLAMLGSIYELSESIIEKRSEEIFTLLEMNQFCDTRIGRLSTGQTQRASIARCFIHDPDYFILDEPTLGLDIISAQTIIDMMKKERAKGKCVLYSTHYMEEAQYLCDRIIMLNHGKILANAGTEELLLQAGTDNLRQAFFELQSRYEKLHDKEMSK